MTRTCHPPLLAAHRTCLPACLPTNPIERQAAHGAEQAPQYVQFVKA